MSQVIDNNTIVGVNLTSKGSGRFVKTFSPTIRCCCVDETVDACSKTPEKLRLSVIDSLLLAVHRSLHNRNSVCFRIRAPSDCALVPRVVVVVFVDVVVETL
jgi:hypothetical protein